MTVVRRGACGMVGYAIFLAVNARTAGLDGDRGDIFLGRGNWPGQYRHQQVRA